MKPIVITRELAQRIDAAAAANLVGAPLAEALLRLLDAMIAQRREAVNVVVIGEKLLAGSPGVKGWTVVSD